MASTPESWAKNATTRAVMLGNKRRDTLPELRVRQLVHAAGLRYRVDFAPSSQNRRLRADLVFTRAKVAVFIDGCFWHGCPQHYVPSRTNIDYWGPKIAANAERDARNTALLETEGWTVLRFWAHTPADEAAARIADAVAAIRPRDRTEPSEGAAPAT
ncbi:very short patch repair endonuclease [Mycobacterium sp. 29Ha]|uniref:very short patch repair endonuclease n=1 Tax=Mycobacterium sp. 29Ha TaxID=2939268 RepID=UPI0029392F3C|nr:very short patch repair endonuclease [Mycobacterium sp. 29Ha]MDV3135415.1 very short patch repair endonuclease [Mycobacterium sp. 29Ha]